MRRFEESRSGRLALSLEVRLREIRTTSGRPVTMPGAASTAWVPVSCIDLPSWFSALRLHRSRCLNPEQ